MDPAAAARLGRINCTYTPVLRGDDFSTPLGEPVRDFAHSRALPSDFFLAQCRSEGGREHELVYATVSHQPAVHRRLDAAHPPAGRKGVDVLVLGLDSMSRLAWRRYMPKSYKYFEGEFRGQVCQPQGMLNPNNGRRRVNPPPPLSNSPPLTPPPSHPPSLGGGSPERRGRLGSPRELCSSAATSWWLPSSKSRPPPLQQSGRPCDRTPGYGRPVRSGREGGADPG